MFTIGLCAGVANLSAPTDGYVLTALGCGLLLVGMTVLRGRPTVTQSEPRQHRPRRSVLPMLILAVLGLAAVVALLTLIGPRLVQWLRDATKDRQRPQVEKLVGDLERKGDWQGAARVLADQLRRPMSAGWLREAERRHHDDLLTAAALKSGPATRELVQQAIAAAEAARLPTAAGQAIRRGQEDAAALRTASADLAALNKQVQSLEDGQRQLSGQLALLAATDKASLLTWGDSLRHEAERAREKYERALTLSDEHGLPTDEIAHRIAQLVPPTEPPADTEIRLVHRQQTTQQLIAEMRIIGAAGQELTGLARHDFRLSVNGQPWERWTIEPSTWAEPHSLAICFDVSLSMQGLPLARGVQALSLLPRQLPTSRFELITFADSVHVAVPWTHDKALLDRALGQLVASGGTALWPAVEKAAIELRDQPGRHTILVCTDGRHSSGATTLAQAIERCRQAEASVFVVSLETTDADPVALARLALETGGLVATASKPAQLTAAFQAIGRGLSQSTYRLTALDTPPTSHVKLSLGVERPASVVVAGDSTSLNALPVGAVHHP